MLIKAPKDHREFSQQYFDYLEDRGKVGYGGELSFIRYFGGSFSVTREGFFKQFDQERDVYTNNNGLWNKVLEAEIKASIRNINDQQFSIPNTPSQKAKCLDPNKLLCFTEWDVSTNLFSFYFCKNKDAFVESRFKDRLIIPINKKNFTSNYIDVYEDKFLIEKIKKPYSEITNYPNMKLVRKII